MLKEKYKRSEDLVWTAINLPYNTRTGNIDINNLISGYTYDIQVSLNDNRNSHLGDRWKGCGQVTPPNYPEPQVTAYSISKSGDTSTAKSSGETLVVKTEDTVNASWNITDTVGVKEDSCRLVTTNTSGGVNADIFGNTTDR